MQHEEEYEVLLSDEQIPVFILKHKELTPNSPFILYDGGQHATFYRSKNEVILFDFLPKEIHNIMKEAKFAIILEMNTEQNDVVLDYKVNIKIVKNNPLTDGLG